MTNNSPMKPIALALGAAFATSLASGAYAAENPFGQTELSSGYMVADSHAKDKAEGKCGEGKCGGDKAKKEGKCGGDKAHKEGKCGGDKAHKEGKCGGDKAKKEGKCGEGKCGGKKAE